MNFKEQLAKHENILNRFKALYINNDNNDQNKNNINENSSKNIMNNLENININKNINNSDINFDLTKYNFSYGKEKTNVNNKIDPLLNNINNDNKYNLPENKQITEKKEEKLDLGKIDNLLDKLNFKRENNINNKIISEEKNNIIKNTEDINLNNNNNKFDKFDIGSIKNKYQKDNINNLNITEKYYNNNKNIEEKNNFNINSSSMNDIKKLSQLNARNEIERIKSKYYTMNLNNIINKKNYLNDDLFQANKNNYNIQLNKDILEIKNKIELYRKEVKEVSLLSQNKKESKPELDSSISKNEAKGDENNISINNNNINNNINFENLETEKNIIENGSNQINIPNLNFKYNLKNNEDKRKENSRKEIDVEINSYENYINNNKKSDRNEIPNNNMNVPLSDIRINSNNQMVNANNNDFDYSEVLPIIDKVSKLKDMNEIEDNYDKQKFNANTQRTYLTNSNINLNTNNEDEEVPNIVNSILDALSNKLITSNIENNQDNEKEKKEKIIEKPKLIPKNNDIDDKTKKIISFKEFLEKEENDNK